MCSYGGHIVPRPHDKSLCYLGGDTRIVVVDRHTTLTDLSAKLSRSLLGGRPFTLKYQLPNEDLDSLISVTTDEDLDNMIEEYDRISSGSTHSGAGGAGGGKSSRLRLFLFPAKSEPSPSSSMGSLVDDSKSETWFVDALNSAIGMGGMLPRGLSADSGASSVNCLLGLEDEQNPSSIAAAAAAANSGPPVDPGFAAEQANHYYPHLHQHQLLQQIPLPPPPQLQQIPPQLPRPDSSGKLAAAAKQGQETSSVPDSPMLDTSSSFGSASSAPSLANLPPIRVRPDDRIPDQRGGGLEDHFSQMNVSVAQKAEEAFREGAPGAFVTGQQFPPQAPFHAPPAPVVAPASTPPVVSPTGNPNTGNRAFFSDDEKPPDHGAPRKPPLPQSQPPIMQQQQQQQPQQPPQVQKVNAAFDLPVPERPVYYQDRTSSGAPMPVVDVKPEGQNPVPDSNYRGQMQVSDQGYVVPIQHEQFQQQPQQQQQQQPQPQLPQYIHAGSHLVQHHPSNTVVPVQSYYQLHPQMHPQQHLPQAAAHHYNPQYPMYFFPVQHSPAAYTMPMQPQQPQQQQPQQQQQQPNLIDPSAIPPAKPTVPIPNVTATGRQAPPAGAPPLRPELLAGANIYRGTTVGSSMVAPPPPTPQLIHIGTTDQSQPQYMSYRPMQHHVSQTVAPGYGYDFSNQVHSQPMFYAPATSAPVPSQYQTVSSAATMISDVSPQLQMQQADGKPGGSSP